MNLPHDTARCPGRITETYQVHDNGMFGTTTTYHSECVRCRRREPAAPDYQWHMGPPVFVDGKCPMRIEP